MIWIHAETYVNIWHEQSTHYTTSITTRFVQLNPPDSGSPTCGTVTRPPRKSCTWTELASQVPGDPQGYQPIWSVNQHQCGLMTYQGTECYLDVPTSAGENPHRVTSLILSPGKVTGNFQSMVLRVSLFVAGDSTTNPQFCPNSLFPNPNPLLTSCSPSTITASCQSWQWTCN